VEMITAPLLGEDDTERPLLGEDDTEGNISVISAWEAAPM